MQGCVSWSEWAVGLMPHAWAAKGSRGTNGAAKTGPRGAGALRAPAGRVPGRRLGAGGGGRAPGAQPARGGAPAVGRRPRAARRGRLRRRRRRHRAAAAVRPGAPGGVFSFLFSLSYSQYSTESLLFCMLHACQHWLYIT
jgi:hypothetical protein